MNLPPVFMALSYVLQMFGFLGIAYAWGRALQEFRTGRDVPKTRLLLFLITSVALLAYVVPVVLALCYFTPGCFQPYYRDYLRLFSGMILFLYGAFKFVLYYTKEEHPLDKR